MHLGKIKLDQILYLLQDALIGNNHLTAYDLADIGNTERARHLQDKGVGLLVADAVDYQEYLEAERRDGRDCIECEHFLNRIRSFPLDWRTPEWEQLIAQLTPTEGIPLTINIKVNGEPQTPTVKKKKKKSDE